MGIGTQGRQLGKSLMHQIIQQHAAQMQKAIDDEIINGIWKISNCRIHKTWRDGQGRKMHRVGVTYKVLEWLKENYSQQGVNNPEWWEFDNAINITDELFTVVLLRWGGDAT